MHCIPVGLRVDSSPITSDSFFFLFFVFLQSCPTVSKSPDGNSTVQTHGMPAT